MISLYESIKNNSNKLKFICVGDVLAHEEIIHDAKTSTGYSFDKMFKYVKPIIKKHDLAFCNQESILGGEKIGLKGGFFKKIGEIENPVFNSPFELGTAVINTGFNLISLANNHVFDNGEIGIRNSLDFWRQQNRIYSGQNNSKIDKEYIKIHSCKGIKYAFISYTTKTNSISTPKGKEYLVNIYSNETVKNDIEKIRKDVDVVIISIHWGTEYTFKPNNEQRDIAKYLSENGADIIIGHHPHVVQPIEFINNTLVIYSLGNFIACQDGNYDYKRIGGMLSFDIEKHANTIKITNISPSLSYIFYDKNKRNFEILPLYMWNNKIHNYKELISKYMDIFKII